MTNYAACSSARGQSSIRGLPLRHDRFLVRDLLARDVCTDNCKQVQADGFDSTTGPSHTCRYPTVLRKFHVVAAAPLDRAGATSAAKWMTLAVASICAAASAANMKAGITGWL